MDISVEEWGLGFVFENFRRFQGEGFFFFWFILALLLLAFTQKIEWKKDFLKYLLGLCLIVFNPFFVTPLVQRLGMEDEYYRLIWLLPVTVFTAWAAVYMIEKGKKVWTRVFLCLACVFLLAAPGKSVRAKGLQMAENIYKVPNEILEISKIIHENSVQTEPIVVNEFELSVLMNQYDPSLQLVLSYGELNMLREYEEYVEQEPDAYWIIARMNMMWLIVDKDLERVSSYDFKTSMDLLRAEYVVCTYEDVMHDFLLASRCIEVGQAGDYRIYRYYNYMEEFPGDAALDF